MQGYVLAFRPATGDGTIVTDSGEAIKFSGANRQVELHGGDIVRFQVGSGQTPGQDMGLRDLEVVQRWPERLTTSHRPLLRELHSTLQMDGPVH
jgi:hypothetical protein